MPLIFACKKWAQLTNALILGSVWQSASPRETLKNVAPGQVSQAKVVMRYLPAPSKKEKMEETSEEELDVITNKIFSKY